MAPTSPLADLIEGTEAKVDPRSDSSIEITGLTADSRQVRPGMLFAALPGSRLDGRTFIGDAIARGASAILAPAGTPQPGGPVALVTDENPRRALALMAARYYERQPRHIAAVTGTNGKTSVADFTRQLWLRLAHPAASLGTLGLVAEGIEGAETIAAPASLTTPDPVSLHACLKDLASAGIEHLAIEASSHGLDQCRLDGLQVGAAAFTNLSRDHLDYHRDSAAYLAAKQRLFQVLLASGGTAVLNADAAEYPALAEIAASRRCRVLSYGRTGRDLKLLEQAPVDEGQRLVIEVMGRRRELTLPLAGSFQAHNALAALGLVIATGSDSLAAAGALSELEGVRGRLERVAETFEGAWVFVDYAHTPDALETALAALRPHTRGRLIVVFGAGGDRDRGKRPLMGAAASRHADLVIVTDDNPRNEDPASIRSEVLGGAAGAREIGDRRAAIDAAIAAARAGDLVLIAGKGHESGQIVRGEVLPFDDAMVVREAVAAQARARREDSS